MNRKLMITTAAAALAAGTLFAAAQGVQPQSPGAGGSGAQNQMPQGKAEPAQPKAQGGQAQQAPEGKGKAQPGQAQAPEGKGKAQSREQAQGQQPPEGKGKAQSKGEPREGQAQRETQPSQPKQTQTQREGEGKAPKAAEGKGSAGGSGSVQLSSEQRTKIRTTVLQGGNAPRVTNVNFNVSVGTVVPRTVRVVAVPATLIEIHPEWRGLMYFVVDERIIIVDDSHAIVAVLVI